MTNFEILLIVLFIPLYGLLFYIAGRVYLFELMFKMAEAKLRELVEEWEEEEGENEN